MTKSAEEFAKLLTKSIRAIAAHQSVRIQDIQQEIGQAAGRRGGTAIEHWRKGYFPRRTRDVEKLTHELAQRGGFINREEAEQFLLSAGYPDAAQLSNQLFPQENQPLDGEISPFIIGWPIIEPRHFFGRDYEVKLIFDLLRRPPMQNIALIGARRSGKTSLLHYLKNIPTASPESLRPNQWGNRLPNPEQYQWVFVGFEDPRMGIRVRLFRHLLDGLGIPAQVDNLYDFLDAISENLARPSIILLDDIGAGLAAPELDQEFWWSLRSLSSNQTQGKLAFILTASQSPQQLAEKHGKPSPFFNIFGHLLTLGPLTENEARELMLSSPHPFNEIDKAWILAQSGGWPTPLQILCHLRLVALEHGQQDDSWQAEALQQIAPLQSLTNS